MKEKQYCVCVCLFVSVPERSMKVPGLNDAPWQKLDKSLLKSPFFFTHCSPECWFWLWGFFWNEKGTKQPPITHTHSYTHIKIGMTPCSPHLSIHSQAHFPFPVMPQTQVFSLLNHIHRTYAYIAHTSTVKTSCTLFHLGCVLASVPFGRSFFSDALLCLRACGNIRSPSCRWWVESKCE